jgi:hypothetical protein
MVIFKEERSKFFDLYYYWWLKTGPWKNLLKIFIEDDILDKVKFIYYIIVGRY